MRAEQETGYSSSEDKQEERHTDIVREERKSGRKGEEGERRCQKGACESDRAKKNRLAAA
ncbi:MAG: hypothetical protein KBT40_02975 [bacterium]|nr:hypothetical protein [Candidatus Minthenecus merdequi]